ncbi:MAG: hypothetical protein HXX14_06660 [Bacteroidetes bacterium]|nr:hypothetical protein [Bacteroidota bacterium]
MKSVNDLKDLAQVLPSGCRMPEDDRLHLIANDNRYLNFFKIVPLYPNHISYFVIPNDQIDLLKDEFLNKVQIIIVEGVGVILTPSCSSDSETILKNMVDWAPYVSSTSSAQYYKKSKDSL